MAEMPKCIRKLLLIEDVQRRLIYYLFLIRSKSNISISLRLLCFGKGLFNCDLSTSKIVSFNYLNDSDPIVTSRIRNRKYIIIFLSNYIFKTAKTADAISGWRNDAVINEKSFCMQQQQLNEWQLKNLMYFPLLS